MLHIFAKNRMRELHRIAVDERLKQANSIHSIASEELMHALVFTEIQCNDILAGIERIKENKGY